MDEALQFRVSQRQLPQIRGLDDARQGSQQQNNNKKSSWDDFYNAAWLLFIFQVPDVRLKCVLALQGLYGDPLFLPKLDLFTSRFKVIEPPSGPVKSESPTLPSNITGLSCHVRALRAQYSWRSGQDFY